MGFIPTFTQNYPLAQYTKRNCLVKQKLIAKGMFRNLARGRAFQLHHSATLYAQEKSPGNFNKNAIHYLEEKGSRQRLKFHQMGVRHGSRDRGYITCGEKGLFLAHAPNHKSKQQLFRFPSQIQHGARSQIYEGLNTSERLPLGGDAPES